MSKNRNLSDISNVTGIIKSDTSGFSGAVAGSDYQSPISLTTTGTSGVASFSDGVLNIPNYGDSIGAAGSAGTSGSSGSTGSSGSSGTSGANGTSGSSGSTGSSGSSGSTGTSGSSGSSGSSGTSGAGTISNGTSGYVTKFTGSTTLGNSLIYDNGSNIGINTSDPGYKFHVVTASQVSSYFHTTSTYAPIAWTGDGGTTKGGVIAHSGVIGIGPLNSGGTGVDGDKSLSINSTSGYVGIGGATTNVALNIKTPGDTGDGTFYSTFTINNTGTSTFSRIRFDRSGVARWGLTLANNDTFRISNLYENGTVTANDATLAIKNNNFVGIGTADPQSRLQIIGGNTTEGQLYVGNTDVTYSAGINFYTSTSNRGFVGWRHTNSGAPFSLTGIHLINTDNSNIVLGTNNTVKAVLNVDGNFGIGITSPAHKLSVNGNARFVITPGGGSDTDRLTIAQNNGTYGIDLVAYGSGANPYNSSQGIFSWGGYDMLVMANNANIKFVTAQYTERARITNAGYWLTYNQPAFMAIGVASGTYVSGNVWIFPTVHLNRSSSYNSSNGTFTAPVAGVYFFSWGHIGGNASTVYRFFLRINGSTFLSDTHLRLDTSASGSEYGTNGNRTAIVNMSAGDYAQIFYSSDSGENAYPNGNDSANAYPNFMGYLIG
jgi:hypothetical protein